MHHIYIGQNRVHQVAGEVAGTCDPAYFYCVSLDFYGVNAGIAVDSDMYNASTYDDVTIENNIVYDLDRVGIYVGPLSQAPYDTADAIFVRPKSTNIIIRNNKVDRSGGDGILNYLTFSTLVDHNTVSNCGLRGAASVGIWSAAADTTTVQYNEVYNENPAGDRTAFDADWGNLSLTIQYNYSHNNYGGFLLIFEVHGAGGGNQIVYSDNLTVRYNISYNDGANDETPIIGVCIGPSYTMPLGLNPPDIDNNTIYLSAGRTTPIFAACGVSNTDAPTINGLAYIYDNIFYVLGTTSYPLFNGTIFDFNTYYAPAYSADRPLNEPCSPGTNICDLVDNHKLTSDPQFVNAGPVRRGMAGVNGLKLKAGSDALASGYNSGYLGPHDYWGNAISTTTAPNRGAYDGPGLP